MTQLVNGIFLLSSFFCCRLLWGTYQSVQVFTDVFHLYFSPPSETHPTADELVHQDPLAHGAIVPHPFAGKMVPLWLAIIYLGSNLILNGLNYFWFFRMIQTVSARFTTPKQTKQKVEPPKNEKVWVEGLDMDIATAAEMAVREAGELRKRLNKA